MMMIQVEDYSTIDLFKPSMSGQGGYLVEQQDVDAPVALLSPSYSGTSHSASRSEPEPLLRLTPRQEGRLRAHLDDKLLGLERDERKK
jgi:hypothetical protein